MNSTSFGNKHAKFTPTDISLWQWMNYFNTTLLLLKRADILFDRVLCLQDSDAFGCADGSSRFISEWPRPSVVVHGKCCSVWVINLSAVQKYFILNRGKFATNKVTICKRRNHHIEDFFSLKYLYLDISYHLHLTGNASIQGKPNRFYDYAIRKNALNHFRKQYQIFCAWKMIALFYKR